jgi:nitrate reductase beta subunit
MKIRAQIAMVLNLDKCIGCHTCSVTCKNVWTSREGWNTPGSTTSRPSPASAIRRTGRTRTAGTAAGSAAPTAGSSRARAASGGCSRIFANPHLPEIDDYYEPFTFDYEHLQEAAHARDAGGAAALADHRPAHGEDRVGAELGEILGGEFEKRAKDYNFEAVRRRSTGSSRTPS